MNTSWKEYLYLSVIAGLFCLGNIYSSSINVLAIIIVYVYILFTNKENALYLVYFLIPNIRIADNIGITSCINLAMLLCGLKWIIKYYRKINIYGFLTILFAFLFSIVNCIQDTVNISYTVSVINIMVDIFIMVAILDLDNGLINIDKITRYLTIGVAFSMLCYIIVHPSAISSVFSSNYRIAGYGDDPNYYSI